MEDSLEKTMMYLFFMENKDTDIYQLNRSTVKYFYSLPSHIRCKMDISYFWGVVLQEWNNKKKAKKNNKRLEKFS